MSGDRHHEHKRLLKHSTQENSVGCTTDCRRSTIFNKFNFNRLKDREGGTICPTVRLNHNFLGRPEISITSKFNDKTK